MPSLTRHSSRLPLADVLGRGFWAVCDQGLFAVSNFTLGVALARWLGPTEYGAYAFAYSVFLLLGLVHNALLTEPMLVFGSAKHKDASGRYFRQLMGEHWRFSAVGGCALVAVGGCLWLAGERMLGAAFLAMGAAAPAVLLSWMTRRACIGRMQPERAAYAGALYLALLMAMLWGASSAELLSTPTSILLMGLASLLACQLMVPSLSRGGNDALPVSRRSVRSDHWEYGRWAIASSALSWVSGNVVLLVLPITAGIEATGALRAVMNLVMPVFMFNVALGTLLLPSLVRVRDDRGRFYYRALQAGVFMVGSALLYWVLIGLFADRLILWLYDGQYGGSGRFLRVLGAFPAAAALVTVLGNVLRALEHPRDIVGASIASAAIAFGVCVPATLAWGMWGAVTGILLSYLTTALVLSRAVLLRRRNGGECLAGLACEVPA